MIRITNGVSRQRFKSILKIYFAVQFFILPFKLGLVIAYDGIDFNINDIFNTNMMPVNIFFDRFNLTLGQKYTKDILPVLRMMSYHRKMMQQFMASDYLTKQILDWKVGRRQSKIKRRIGKLQNISNLYSNDEFNMLHVASEPFEKLLLDDGSTRYNAWLKRKTTLDDIQHQINTSAHYLKINQNPIRRQIMRSATNFTSLGDEENDFGDITGYAYEGSHNDSKYPNVSPIEVMQTPRFSMTNPQFGLKMKQISKNGYENVPEDVGVHQSPPEHANAISQPTTQIKEISIKDITDIALTTLAFLSFGMFILQVLMCITMSKDEGNNLMMLPMEATEIVDTSDGTEEIRRRKRSIQDNPDVLEGVNQLTQILLITIDNLYLTGTKKPNMKHYFQLLCGYSALKMETNYNQKIWTTLYSLGTSWLASRNKDNFFLIIKHITDIFEVCT